MKVDALKALAYLLVAENVHDDVPRFSQSIFCNFSASSAFVFFDIIIISRRYATALIVEPPVEYSIFITHKVDFSMFVCKLPLLTFRQSKRLSDEANRNSSKIHKSILNISIYSLKLNLFNQKS